MALRNLGEMIILFLFHAYIPALISMIVFQIAENAWIVWAIAAVLCLILELMSGGLVLLCFAVGAAAAAIASPFAGVAFCVE